MSFAEDVESTGNKRVTNYNTAKLFIGFNEYTTATYTNSTGDDVVLEEGTLMGRIASSGKIVPLEFDAADGSQFPVGVLAAGYTIPNGDTATLTMCVSGEVAQELLVLEYGTTLDSIIDSRRLIDRIGADTVGIKLVTSQEQTDYDN